MSLYLVEAPKVAPATGGLLPLANVITTEADRVAFHGPTHEAVLSGHTRTVPTDNSNKVFDKIQYIDGVTFASYRGIDSALLLGVDGEPIARDQFEAGESYAIESAVQSLLLNPKAVDITPTPGTPVTNVKAALGLLEQYMADNYTGLPLLHGNRFAVSLPLELVREGGKLSTINGSPIANGGGYGPAGPGSVTAPAKAAWLYASGQVNLWRGKLNVVSGPAQYNNRDFALAETPYAATIDGPVAAILVGF